MAKPLSAQVAAAVRQVITDRPELQDPYVLFANLRSRFRLTDAEKAAAITADNYGLNGEAVETTDNYNRRNVALRISVSNAHDTAAIFNEIKNIDGCLIYNDTTYLEPFLVGVAAPYEVADMVYLDCVVASDYDVHTAFHVLKDSMEDHVRKLGSGVHDPDTLIDTAVQYVFDQRLNDIRLRGIGVGLSFAPLDQVRQRIAMEADGQRSDIGGTSFD